MVKFKYLFLVYCLSYSYLVFGQNEINNTDSIYIRNEIVNYLLEYDMTFDASILYKIASRYSVLNKIDSSFYFLNLSIDKGKHSGWVLYDPDFENIKKYSQWQIIVERINNLYLLKHPSIDTTVFFELRDLYWTDQKIRYELTKMIDQYGFNSIELDVIKTEAKKKDSINIFKFNQLFEKNGWFTIDKVGSGGMLAVFTILQHSPLSIQKKYLPFIQESVKNGDISSSAYAYFIDRMLIHENKLQRYGTQLRLKYGQDKAYELSPVEDELNLNNRRSEMGLEPIEDYLMRQGIEYKTTD